jgi:LPS-assembly lipoprotein
MRVFALTQSLKKPFSIAAFLLILSTAFLQSGCSLYQSKPTFIPYKAVVVTGSLSPRLLHQLQFHILAYINIKVAIHPKDADLILEIIQEVPNS